MASASGRPSPSLIGELAERPGRFGFFQAVRICEALARAGGAGAAPTVGEDARPALEAVRLRVDPSMRFPGGEVRSAQLEGEETEPTALTVAFLGLTGAVGSLPLHYTETLQHRVHVKDATLRDFVDIFHHRTLSLFFRAWRKYRFAFAYESARHRGADDDLFSDVLRCLIGIGHAPLQRRMSVEDETLMYHAGHFARQVPSASGLASLVESLVGFGARIEQLVGRWFTLQEADRSRVGVAHHQLGAGLLLGAQVWDVGSMVRVHLDPLDYETYCDMMPGGSLRERLRDLLRTYLGTTTEVEMVLRLETGAAPPFRLGDAAPHVRLGRDTWLGPHPPSAQPEARFSLQCAAP